MSSRDVRIVCLRPKFIISWGTLLHKIRWLLSHIYKHSTEYDVDSAWVTMTLCELYWPRTMQYSASHRLESALLKVFSTERKGQVSRNISRNYFWRIFLQPTGKYIEPRWQQNYCTRKTDSFRVLAHRTVGFRAVKFTLEQATKAQSWRRGITPHFLWRWMGVRGQRHSPATLRPGKTRYPLYRRLGGPQGRSGRVRNILPPPGFDPRTVQPVASRYTDWAMAAHRVSWSINLNLRI